MQHALSHPLVILVLIQIETLTTIALALLDFMMQESINVPHAIPAVHHAKTAQPVHHAMPEISELSNQVFVSVGKATLS